VPASRRPAKKAAKRGAPPEERAERQALQLVRRFQGIDASVPGSYDATVEFRTQLKDFEANVDELFDPILERTRAAHQAALAQKNKVLAPVKVALRQVDAAIGAYIDAEQERLQLEAAREQEAAAAAANAVREAQVAAAREAGFDEESLEALAEEAAPTALARVAKLDTGGVSTRDVWSAEVTDIHALIDWVSKNHDFAGLLRVDQVSLNAQARALKAGMKFPGVRAVRRTSVATRRR
jgi:hypothetical protein